MKTIFVGPSLPDMDQTVDEGILIQPPACQGDVMRAVLEGAKVIGLIDGQFEYVAPVWHKELLFALSKGIVVLGAASMGALRAAECADFGMIGVGKIFGDYMSGKRVDDADVALQHGPAELSYIATSVPMVNVDATLEKACSEGWFSRKEANTLNRAAQDIHFKQRSWQRIIESAGLEWKAFKSVVKRAEVDQKRIDALMLIDAVKSISEVNQEPAEWSFNQTPLWRSMYSKTR